MKTCRYPFATAEPLRIFVYYFKPYSYEIIRTIGTKGTLKKILTIVNGGNVQKLNGHLTMSASGAAENRAARSGRNGAGQCNARSAPPAEASTADAFAHGANADDRGTAVAERAAAAMSQRLGRGVTDGHGGRARSRGRPRQNRRRAYARRGRWSP